MPEYIVDCEHVPYGEGKTLVLPISINGHVHERLIRCKDCDHCHKAVNQYAGEVRYECRLNIYSRHYTELDGFCNRAVPRSDDGNRT